MIVPFLRADAEDVALAPVPKGAPLPRLALRSPESAELASIELAIVRAGGDVVGLVALGPLDWIRRSAGLAARGRVDAATLGLVARYAFDELNLERLDTDPVDATLAPLLREAGYAPAGDRWSCLRDARP
jgi:hypothetical protein